MAILGFTHKLAKGKGAIFWIYYYFWMKRIPEVFFSFAPGSVSELRSAQRRQRPPKKNFFSRINYKPIKKLKFPKQEKIVFRINFLDIDFFSIIFLHLGWSVKKKLVLPLSWVHHYLYQSILNGFLSKLYFMDCLLVKYIMSYYP